MPAPIKQLPSPAWRQFQRWVEAASTRAASRQLPAHIRPKGTHQNPRFYRDSIIRPVATMLQEIGTPWSDAADIALHTTGQALAAIALHQDETAQRQVQGPDRQRRAALMLRSKAAGPATEMAAGPAPEMAAGPAPKKAAGPLPKKVPKKATGAVPSLAVPSLASLARGSKVPSLAGSASGSKVPSLTGSASGSKTTGAASPVAGWRHVTAIGSKAAAIRLHPEPPRKV